MTMRQTSVVSNALLSPVTAGAELKVDSGWDARGVRIDLQTSRGKTVTLSVEQWRELSSAVEKIIADCTEKVKPHPSTAETGGLMTNAEVEFDSETLKNPIQLLREQLNQIDRKIGALIDEEWQLVKPLAPEVQDAITEIKDDPYNSADLASDPDSMLGRWNLLDQVLFAREDALEQEQEEQEQERGASC